MIKIYENKDKKKLLRQINESIMDDSDIEKSYPINYLKTSYLWWKHFNNSDGTDFASKRGRNYLGLKSWLNKFYLISEWQNDKIVGIVPLVDFTALIEIKDKPIRILALAGDPALIPYRDFIIEKKNGGEILLKIFNKIMKLYDTEYDMLYFSSIKSDSENIERIRGIIRNIERKNLCYENVTSIKPGLWPWNIEKASSAITKLADKIDMEIALKSDIIDLSKELKLYANGTKIMFPGKRISLEKCIIDMVDELAKTELNCLDLSKIRAIFELKPLLHYYINLPNEQKEYLNSLSKNTRSQIKKYKNKFIRSGGSFEKICNQDLDELCIEDFLRLHLMRWGNRSTAISKQTMPFHRELIKNMAKEKYLSLFFARMENKRIAAQLCFDSSNKREAYYTGRDITADNYHAGKLLYYETIADAIENKLSIYDLGQGDAQYKRHFANLYLTTTNFIISKKKYDLNKIFIGFESMA